MIQPKRKQHVTVSTDLMSVNDIGLDEEQEAVEIPKNPLSEVYWAAKRAVQSIRENEDDPESPPLFKTVAIDTGQFNRLVLSENTETEILLPAVFIHYTNVRYLVQQNRIGEGRATMRIRYVTNVLNNQDPDTETNPFDLFQKINVAIQDAKDTEPYLNERCQLTFFDMPETTNMLQAYWIDYEIWFRETSAWKYRNWKKVYAVMPPFTNHSDKPEHNTHSHPDHDTPTYDEASRIEEPDVTPSPT